MKQLLRTSRPFRTLAFAALSMAALGQPIAAQTDDDLPAFPVVRGPNQAAVAAGIDRVELDARLQMLADELEVAEGKLQIISTLSNGPFSGLPEPPSEQLVEPGLAIGVPRELLVDRALTIAYRNADQAAREDIARGQDVLAVALRHWIVELRRNVGPSLRTEVPGLTTDPDCAVDLIADGILTAYFDALVGTTSAFGPSPGNDAASARRQADIVAALQRVAAAEACLSARQSALLAAASYRAFESVAQILRDNGQADMIERLAGALSSPLLLIYDVEKRRGPLSPLAIFFTENRDALLRLADQGRLPASWHGLWLYDWRTGRLLGFEAAEPQPQAADSENIVALSPFLGSIVNATALGDYSCGLADMVQRGPTPLGYLCGGQVCQARSERGVVDIVDRLRKAPAFATVRIEAAEPTYCSGDSLPVPQSGDARCADISGIAGVSRADEAIACLTTQIVDPGAEGLACVIEKSGTCASPLDRFTKEMAEQAMAGVKMTRGCERAETAGQNPNAQRLQDMKKEMEAADKKLEAKEKEINDAVTVGEKNPDDGAAEIAEARQEHQKEMDAIKDKYADLMSQRGVNDALDAALKKNNDDYGNDPAKRQQWNDADAAAFKLHADLTGAAGSGKISWGEAAIIMNNFEPPTPKTSGMPACNDSLGNCETSTCSAMAESTRQLLDCVTKAFSPQEQRPIGQCDPEVCDDFDARQPLPPVVACFTSILDGPLVKLAQACWSVRCGPGFGPVQDGADCRCEPEGGVGGAVMLPEACSQMLCAWGKPTVRNGSCSCDDGALPTGGSAPRPKFDLPQVSGDPHIPVIFGGGGGPFP